MLVPSAETDQRTADEGEEKNPLASVHFLNAPEYGVLTAYSKYLSRRSKDGGLYYAKKGLALKEEFVMKILITTDWYKPAVNGVVTSVVSLVDGLAAEGAEVRILTLSSDLHSYTKGNVTYLGSVGVGRIYPNARLKAAPSSRYVQELVKWRPDIVHSQCEFSTFFLARKIAEACRCPLVQTYHTDYENFTHYFSPNVRFGKYMAAAFSKKILSGTNLVIVPTGKVKDILCGYGVRTPVTVIPSGLELNRFEAGISPGERTALRKKLGIEETDKVLLYLGRLAKEKNIDELLSLFARQKNPQLKLLLVGDGPYREELERRAESYYGTRVIFAGMVAPGEVARYYALGDIFISASQSETQGLTYIEAMAAGLPLLCREDPCLSGVIEDGGNGLTYSDEKEFSVKLCSLLTDSDFRRKLGSAARETVFCGFSSAGFAERVLRAYRSLLSDAGKELVNAA